MLPFAPPLLLLLLMAALAPPTPCASQELQVRGHRTQREAKQDTIKVLVSGGCVSHGDTSHLVPGGQELELAPGSPLVLTHQIKLVPSGSGSGPGSCGCESDFAALRERLERLEREVSALRDKCGGADGGCCSSEESQGAGCSIKPKEDECPDECSDQGRCVDGRCECFPGFSGPDCSDSNCPGNCHHRGRCVAGQCVCDPGFSGPDCSGTSCPDACRGHGRCVDAECVCDPGFAGADCSEMSCPANCHHRGRCVDGQCVCDEGFRGADCSEQTCPNDCNGRGKCVDGKCVCSSDFTGDDCADDSCPGHCGSRGRCVNAQCVCDDGFTGAECGEKTCPNNCSGRGRCVEGKCVCSVGSAGPDCSEAKACPGNCTSRGRCIKGRCVCRRGFTGPDCSRCEDGRTGPTCDTVMSGVSQLRTQDVTESSVTLLWSQPAVQYDSYLLTFSSQKDRDQQVEAQVDGGLSSFTQTGLAAGQQFSATITGEVGGRRGAQSSTEFMTLISGPTDLRVVKMTSTSAVVQWDRPQGEVHRYRLSITPSDGAGKTQEVTVPGDQDSAHIGQLEAGRSYDIILVAEKGASQSQPATTQVVPGPEPPTDIAFSEVTENSLTVSWTKPKTPVSGFKVTYTHSEDEEPVSVSLDSEDSSVGLSQLSPGSTYEVSILSILGLDESDPVQDLVSTLPDPPTHLRAVNVTDTKALLLWRPALASVDKYTIVYGSGSGSELRITVSGNAAEQQLSGLEASTTYTVTISSQLGGGESPAAATSFTTSRGSDGDVPRDLQADHVTPRSARLSWRAAGRPAAGYRLTYQTGGREVKEVLVDSSVNELNLTGLDPGSKYTVQLQAEAGGRFTSSVSTEFTTGALRFPFPTDCSQELLNGFGASGEVEIFPQGNQGASIRVYCDMETDGGGWTVFQRRKDGSVDFFRGWRDYVKGFGDLSGEFWLGLESLHNLTTLSRMSLRVDLRDGDDSVFAKYSTFAVARRNYRLSVGGYSGDAGDSLSYHNNRVFSTKDRDPSPFITRCAMSYRGGWWYQNCHQANLNGLYGIDVKHQGIIWTSWKGKDTSIAFTEMKMRPASFSPAARG
ncbi:tenascin-X isoform X2 [Platichthys flesus]|uniref:tenascin-X isoform X2 n=1 Tax=Platichthys flesus TaxID=8260 RepID=UPI002DBC27FF|nr:tenascin-X isoform X2 [Platichthys flesus]